MPNGPTRFGPRRPCIFATTRRSISVIYAKAVSKARITIALLMTAATIALLRKSSTRHLLLLSAHALRSQLYPIQTCIEWILFGNFQQYLFRAGITPLCAHMPGYLDTVSYTHLRAHETRHDL